MHRSPKHNSNSSHQIITKNDATTHPTPIQTPLSPRMYPLASLTTKRPPKSSRFTLPIYIPSTQSEILDLPIIPIGRRSLPVDMGVGMNLMKEVHKMIPDGRRVTPRFALGSIPVFQGFGTGTGITGTLWNTLGSTGTSGTSGISHTTTSHNNSPRAYNNETLPQIPQNPKYYKISPNSERMKCMERERAGLNTRSGRRGRKGVRIRKNKLNANNIYSRQISQKTLDIIDALEDSPPVHINTVFTEKVGGFKIIVSEEGKSTKSTKSTEIEGKPQTLDNKLLMPPEWKCRKSMEKKFKDSEDLDTDPDSDDFIDTTPWKYKQITRESSQSMLRAQNYKSSHLIHFPQDDLFRNLCIQSALLNKGVMPIHSPLLLPKIPGMSRIPITHLPTASLAYISSNQSNTSNLPQVHSSFPASSKQYKSRLQRHSFPKTEEILHKFHQNITETSIFSEIDKIQQVGNIRYSPPEIPNNKKIYIQPKYALGGTVNRKRGSNTSMDNYKGKKCVKKDSKREKPASLLDVTFPDIRVKYSQIGDKLDFGHGIGRRARKANKGKNRSHKNNESDMLDFETPTFNTTKELLTNELITVHTENIHGFIIKISKLDNCAPISTNNIDSVAQDINSVFLCPPEWNCRGMKKKNTREIRNSSDLNRQMNEEAFVTGADEW